MIIITRHTVSLARSTTLGRTSISHQATKEDETLTYKMGFRGKKKHCDLKRSQSYRRGGEGGGGGEQYTKPKNESMRVEEMGNERGNLRERVSQKLFRIPSSWPWKGPIYRGQDYSGRLSLQSYQLCPHTEHHYPSVRRPGWGGEMEEEEEEEEQPPSHSLCYCALVHLPDGFSRFQGLLPRELSLRVDVVK